jgi:hypothetical protein
MCLLDRWRGGEELSVLYGKGTTDVTARTELPVRRLVLKTLEEPFF